MLNSNSEVASWFYEEKGERKGGIPEPEFINLIKTGKLSRGTSIWKKGFPDWVKIENTEMKDHLDDMSPPPLKGEHVQNNLIWVLAFAPVIGYLLECFIAGMFNHNSDRAMTAVANGHYMFISIILNIALSYFDEKRLQKAGHDTSKFKGMVWLVPVYLFQRAKALNQNMAYFAVWVVSFLLVLFGV